MTVGPFTLLGCGMTAPRQHLPFAPHTASRQPARPVSGSRTSTNTTSSSGSAARFDTGPVPLERLQEAIHSMGLKKFRKYQGRGVAAVCRGQDTLMMIPTGGGKSLCFQILPLVLLGKVAIVVSCSRVRISKTLALTLTHTAR